MVSTSEVVCSTNTPRDMYIFLYECDGTMAEWVGFASEAAENSLQEEHVERDKLMKERQRRAKLPKH